MNTFTKLFLVGSLMIGANAVQAAPAKNSSPASNWYKAGALSLAIGSGTACLTGLLSTYEFVTPTALGNIWSKITIPSLYLAGILGSIGYAVDRLADKSKDKKEQE